MKNLQALFGSFRDRIQSAHGKGLALFKQTLANPLYQSAEVADDESVDGDSAEVKHHLSEKNISSQLLRISVIAVSFKALLYIAERKWLSAVVSGFNSVLAAPFWIWMSLMGLTWAIMPLLCGVAMIVITWYTVFLDYCIPGAYPCAPETARKHRSLLPHPFHLGHSIALVNGFLLLVLMYVGYNNPLWT